MTVVPLTGTVSGQGAVTATPLQAVYERGQRVTLQAVAAEGWRCAAWAVQGVKATATLLLTAST